MSGFAWSQDGTKLAIANTSDDNIKVFTCSTPFDPDTAGGSPSVFGITNPWGGLHYNKAGTKIASIYVVGDVIAQWNCSSHVLSDNVVDSNLTKAEGGHSGTQDGPFTCNQDMSRIYWFGDSDRFNRIGLSPAGDFDSFSLDQTATPFSQNFNLGSQITTMNLGEDAFYITIGGTATNLRLYEMSTAQDTSTCSLTGTFDCNTITGTRPGGSSWRADKCWIDPEDTTHIWVAVEFGVTDMAFAKLKLN